MKKGLKGRFQNSDILHKSKSIYLYGSYEGYKLLFSNYFSIAGYYKAYINVKRASYQTGRMPLYLSVCLCVTD